jgi:transcription elongation factor GreA
MNARTGLGAADLFRRLGLLADGPVLWGTPVAAEGPGVLVVELAEAHDHPPLEMGVIGRWLEHAPGLRIDGRPATGRELAARLERFWLPGQTVVFIARAPGGLGRRLTGLYATPPWAALPDPDGRWLKVLSVLPRARVWWAETDRDEEAEFELLEAFAEGVPREVRLTLPDPDLVLPFATLRHTLGDEKPHGITDDLVVPAGARSRPRRPTASTAGEGAGTPKPQGAGKALARATGGVPAPGAGGVAGHGARGALSADRGTGGAASRGTGGAVSAGRTRTRRLAPPTAAERRASTPIHLTAEGLEQLKAELADLREIRRPAAIARVAAARELGDLSENAEYHAAREELGFIEGRIRSLEDRLRRAMVVSGPGDGQVGMGSKVVVEVDGTRHEFALVGSTEANPAEGRISTSSPVGRALLGRRAGDEVVVRTPGGEVRYRIVSVE